MRTYKDIVQFWAFHYAIALPIGIAIDFVLVTNLIAVAYIVHGNVPENVFELIKWLCL